MNLREREGMVQYVSDHLQEAISELPADKLIGWVLHLLDRRIAAGERADLKRMLPEDALSFWHDTERV